MLKKNIILLVMGTLVLLSFSGCTGVSMDNDHRPMSQ